MSEMSLRDELALYLSPRQLALLDGNIHTFGSDLRATVLWPYTEEGEQPWDDKHGGRIFLHVHSRHRGLAHDYPTELGFFENAYELQGKIFHYIMDRE